MLRTLARPQLAGLWVTWIAAVSVVAGLVLAGRQQALTRGLEDTAALSAAIEQVVARTFQTLYLTISSVADAYQLRPRPEKNDPDFQQLMTRRLQDVPFTRALFIIGPDGWIIHDTDYPTTPALSLFDRPYFQAYLEDNDYPATVWPPLQSRSGTGWFLPVTEALGRSAEFEGVVAAALQADHFSGEFQSMGLADSYFVALFHLDGTLVASHPPRPDDVGRRFSELPALSEYQPGGHTSYQSAGWLVPGERVISYRALGNTPLAVLVSLGKDDILAEWRRTAAAAALAMLALTAFLVRQTVRFSREEAQRERERERQTQVEKLEALGQLMGGIAHDFSNVLQIVAANVDVLKSRPNDALATREAVEYTERAVRDAAAMVDRLLGLSRKKPLKLSRLCFDDWLDSARPLLSQAAGPGVSLVIDAAGPLPQVVCDANGLDMALVNLVVNSRHAMKGRGRVLIRAFRCEYREPGVPAKFVANPPQYVCLSVQDDGPGMPEDVKRRAMEPFFTTKGENGTGLGLSQVYGFMRQLGGGMTIESTLGHGTVVQLFFPVASAEDDGSGAGYAAS